MGVHWWWSTVQPTITAWPDTTRVAVVGTGGSGGTGGIGG